MPREWSAPIAEAGGYVQASADGWLVSVFNNGPGYRRPWTASYRGPRGGAAFRVAGVRGSSRMFATAGAALLAARSHVDLVVSPR